MSYRTLKFGDRTISYDAGLNSLPPGITLHQDEDKMDATVPAEVPRKLPVSPDLHNDDGIGSSDDGAGHSSNASTNEDIVSNPSSLAESEKTSSLFESDASPNLTLQSRKKVIRPDPSAINQLLAFDEEEEDQYEDENYDDDLEAKGEGSQWQRTIVKDLANLSPSHGIQRRHSISICESKKSLRRTSSNSGSGSSQTSTASSSRTSSNSSSPKHSRIEDPSIFHNNSMASNQGSYRLDVGQMHASLRDEFENVKQPWMKTGGNSSESLKTLSLNLEEVVHIRSVLTKAELEGLPIDGNVRSNVENGRVCFLCMKTKFGLFTRGHKCEMCKQIVCYRCHSKMKIPTEHFNNTPVFALSPTSPTQGLQVKSQDSNFSENQSTQDKAVVSSHCREKKMSLPGSLGLLGAANSVGSAPNSPNMNRKNCDVSNDNSGVLPTISGNVDPHGHVSLPPAALNKKYNTLPSKTRRMSWISSRNSEREKLEGSLLTICSDCKDMVLQVIRASRTTKRIHMVKSMFSNLTPNTASR